MHPEPCVSRTFLKGSLGGACSGNALAWEEEAGWLWTAGGTRSLSGTAQAAAYSPALQLGFPLQCCVLLAAAWPRMYYLGQQHPGWCFEPHCSCAAAKLHCYRLVARLFACCCLAEMTAVARRWQ